jgi:ribosome maturation factor RimP
MIQDIVHELVQNALKERQDLFLIDLNISTDNAISIVIDGDKGVSVEDCMFISRAVEHNIDRDDYDFSIEVLSAGATAPLQFPRQYHKHVGRHLDLRTLNEEKYEGQLDAVTEDAVVLKWKTREPKPVGKGKVTVWKEAKILFKDIKEARVKIKF